MLPAAHRLRSSADFTAVTRGGQRARCGRLVVYLLPPVPVDPIPARRTSDQTVATTRAGLIVSRTVGGSVVRNQVSRRLRAQVAGRLDRIPSGSRMVVRALPASAGASSGALGGDLDVAFRRLTGGRQR
ncbi:MAG: ribonuclease P protein component [Jatrophihabitans sp.]